MSAAAAAAPSVWARHAIVRRTVAHARNNPTAMSDIDALLTTLFSGIRSTGAGRSTPRSVGRSFVSCRERKLADAVDGRRGRLPSSVQTSADRCGSDWRGFSRFSSRPRRTGWAWACRLFGASWKRTADVCQQRTNMIWAPPCASRCRWQAMVKLGPRRLIIPDTRAFTSKLQPT